MRSHRLRFDDDDHALIATYNPARDQHNQYTCHLYFASTDAFEMLSSAFTVSAL